MRKDSNLALNDRGRSKSKWLNRSVLGIGLASLFSDWSHEAVTSTLPVFLAGFGAAAAWLGIIEGIADGVSSFAKFFSGFYTDKAKRRKPIAMLGYTITALCTGLMGIATAAWQVLLFRVTAWFGRGIRTPVRKTLLAAGVTPECLGRAFGFERMMDTIGAILGPLTAFLLLPILHHNFCVLFAIAAVPGLIATLSIWALVREADRPPVPHLTMKLAIKQLPATYRRFLLGVGVFGMGDFSHALLILFSTLKLAPIVGNAKAAAISAALYLLRNCVNAGFALVAGWLADRFEKRIVLASGYALAAVMCLIIILAPPGIWSFTTIFVLGGMYIAIEETVEDSFCAQLVPPNQHGTAFGLLAAVNAVGDMLSSITVGLLWQHVNETVAFGFSLVMFAIGSGIIATLVTPPLQSTQSHSTTRYSA